MPRSSGDVRINFNEVAGIKPVVTQRYCGELVSKNRCGELRQKPDYPSVAPSSVVDKQLRVCNQRRQKREMRESFAPSCYHHDIAVPSAVLHSPNCIDNTDRFGGQNSEVKRGVGRAESAPLVNIAECAVTSQILQPKGDCGKVFSDASAKHQNVKQPASDSNISLEREAQVVLAPKSDNVSKAVNERGLPLDVGFPASVVNVVSSCEPENVVDLDVGSLSCLEVQNTHNEHLEDQTCALSESSLLVSDSSSDFREVDQLASKQQAADVTEFEKSSSNCSTALEMKHLRSDEAASLETSKNGNGQEASVQQVGEFNTSSDNAAESNVQLCDKLSAAVNTSRSKTDPADEMSPKATDNCVSVDNVSAQLAASSSSDLCVNSISLAVAEDCAPNESTKNASGRNRSVNLPLGEAERHQKQISWQRFFSFRVRSE